MPQMIIDPQLTPESYFGEYMQTYIERDIRQLVEVKTNRISRSSLHALQQGQVRN